jgi:hypothetical protein
VDQHAIVFLMLEHPADAALDLRAVGTFPRQVPGRHEGHHGQRRGRRTLAVLVGAPRAGRLLGAGEIIERAGDRGIDGRGLFIRDFGAGDGRGEAEGQSGGEH